MLSQVLVLDFADEQGSLCSRLLESLGAEVIRLQAPGARTVQPRDRFSKPPIILDLQTRAGKKSLRALIKKSDVFIETFRPGTLESLNLDYPHLRKIRSGLIHLSITPFGRSGPRSHYLSSDRVAAAFGGQTFLCGAASGPPLKLPGPQSYHTASLFGAVSVLLRLRKRRVTGRGSHIDISVQEAVASTLADVMINYFHDGEVRGRSEIDSEGFAAVPCRDGYVLISILGSWNTLLELAASEQAAGDLLGRQWRDAEFRRQHFGHILDVIGKWTSRHSKWELFHLGQAMHFPWAAISTADEVTQSPQLRSRRFFDEVPHRPYRFSVPTGALRHARRLHGKKPAPHAEKRRSEGEILYGLRVLDLTRMLSGPYATRIFADFGAEVLKVQSEKTTNGMERNDTAAFAAWNRNKQSIILDLDQPEAREELLRLAAKADVLVENFSPRVMANWGLDYDRLKERNPGLVMLSLSAMGQTGPWKDYVGFAPTFHALSGLLSPSPENKGKPIRINHPYADVIAGLYAAMAILSALEYREATGIGRYIDLSACEAICAPALGAGQAPPESPLSGTYRCSGNERWCVISIQTEEQAQKLRNIIKAAELTADSIEAWTAARDPESVTAQLQEEGIPAGVVLNAKDLAEDPQLAARRFFVTLKHPELGPLISDRSPLWDWRVTPRWRASPMPGRHSCRW